METTPFRLQFTQPIRVLIARQLMGLASAHDIVDCAHALTDAGYNSISLGAIISAVGVDEYDLNDLFAQLFDELERPLPSLQDAVCELEAGYWISISEFADPSQISSRANSDRMSTNYAVYIAIGSGEARWGTFEKLIDYFWEYDYPEKDRNETNAMIDGKCISVAIEWTRKYWHVILDPVWLTPTVQSIAAAIYQDRAFDRLPILADALEEAGCTNADVLLHCRQPGEHVRGCWVIDLVLGKK